MEGHKLMRTYEELITIPTYEERYNYLRLESIVGEDTFGSRRYLNQMLYASPEWKRIRRDVIARDLGRDLAHADYDIRKGVIIIVHHMNPITIEDILTRSELVYNPRYLITTTDTTHRAIHYGDKELLNLEPIIRMPNDTCPWK